MGLDSRLYVIYGYRFTNRPIYEKMEVLYKENKISDTEYNETFDNLSNAVYGLLYIDDSMCGNYEYIGIPIYSERSDYGEDNHFGISMNDLLNITSDEKLDKLVQEQLHWITEELHDTICGEKPKLWVIKNVW